MTVDPAGWFLDANGAVVDPADSADHDIARRRAICEDARHRAGPLARQRAPSVARTGGQGAGGWGRRRALRRERGELKALRDSDGRRAGAGEGYLPFLIGKRRRAGSAW